MDNKPGNTAGSVNQAGNEYFDLVLCFAKFRHRLVIKCGNISFYFKKL
jgi:hypothetical protein